jgi:flagellin
MNSINSNMNALVSSNALRTQNQRSADAMTRLSTGNRITSGTSNAASYSRASTINTALRTAVIANANINHATALINSIDASAGIIQDKLQFMLEATMSVTGNLTPEGFGGDKGIICDRIQRALEDIIYVANNHDFAGKNYMKGGNNWPTWLAEPPGGTNNTSPDETTIVYVFDVNIGAGDNFAMDLKSYHPYSTVSVNRPYSIAGRFYGNVATPNIPVLNKTAGTDTHAYGDAALYHGNNLGNPYVEGQLHVDDENSAAHTIYQIQLAIDGVAADRTRLGAYRNRLTHIAENNISTVSRLGVTKSLVMDTEIATAVAELSKSQILSRSATAMVAQANISGNRLLELLK